MKQNKIKIESEMQNSTKKLTLLYLNEIRRAKTYGVTMPMASGFYRIVGIKKAVEHENWRELRVVAHWCPLDWKNEEMATVEANLSPLFLKNSCGDKELPLKDYLYLILKVENERIFKSNYNGIDKSQIIFDWEILGVISDEEIKSLIEEKSAEELAVAKSTTSSNETLDTASNPSSIENHDEAYSEISDELYIEFSEELVESHELVTDEEEREAILNQKPNFR